MFNVGKGNTNGPRRKAESSRKENKKSSKKVSKNVPKKS